MKLLVQCAPRPLVTGVASSVISSSAIRASVKRNSSICVRCQFRAESLGARRRVGDHTKSLFADDTVRRGFLTSRRLLEGKNRDHDLYLPRHPTSSAATPGSAIDTQREPTDTKHTELSERDRSLQERLDAAMKEQQEKEAARLAPKPEQPPEAPTPSPQERQTSPQVRERPQQAPIAAVKRSEVVDNVNRVPDEHLPSHRDGQRWNLSKRFSTFMDEVLPKLALVTQKVNTYTGTDYSGIEALRREIQEQEQLVKARHHAIDIAKQAYDTAHARQASSQKEVVALLERKHSWSASDLERYMSLIRSEHVNDQAVREAKDAVHKAEAMLEEARSRLEKRERAQYHEEQIWSDTIRRNSTWVTFGLMGFNIFLLLLSLAILEPWRRRRMVREIKTALEAQKVAVDVAPAVRTQEVVLGEVAQDQVPAHTTSPPVPVPLVPQVIVEEATPHSPSNNLPESIIHPEPEPVIPIATPPPTVEPIPIKPEPETPFVAVPTSAFGRLQSTISHVAQDVFSDRTISMRRIDYTAAIVQGAAAGAVIAVAVIQLVWGA